MDSLSYKERLALAVEWYLENLPKEKATTAARIYNVKSNSVRVAAARQLEKKGRVGIIQNGGQNKILSDTQDQAIIRYIRDQVEMGLGATKRMIFAAISHLKEAESPPKLPPSWRWFQYWLKAHPSLHIIKTKPIARARVEIHTEKTVEEWFDKLRAKLIERKITRGKNIYNFDETGVRTGCPTGEEIVVPTDVKELYTKSPENRKSLSIIESISADGSEPIPPTIICPGKRMMENWFHDNLKGDELILLSDSGYTNEELAIRWLKHFIKHTKAGPNEPWKLLLMDGHKSHENPDFVLLALENHIDPFLFPSHLTHVLQPLDVGVFRPWKHWHNQAIITALRTLDLEYSITSLFRDLGSIREATFKPDTIKNAFKEAGIWPISCKTAIKKMRQYSPPKASETPDQNELPALPSTPKTLWESEISITEWDDRIPDTLSSPSARRYKKTVKGVKINLARASL
jgi:hypothetical protein